MSAGLHARVSTHDQQTLGLQTESMSAYLKDRSWKIVSQVKDVGSGAKERPGRESLLRAARRREVADIARRLGIGRTSARRIVAEGRGDSPSDWTRPRGRD